MKNILKIILFIVAVVGFMSCEKDENRNYLEGGKAPVLSANRSGTIPLTFATAGNEAITLNWTNPDYKFTTGVSSQDVNYIIEIDTVGANFTNPNRQTIAVSKELSRTFTQSQINDYLLNQLQLRPGKAHQIEIRVKSSLIANTAVLASNILKFTVTPYSIPPKIAPPASGKLYITGSATPGNWMGGGDPELVNQRFTKISDTEYVLNSIALNGGQSYLFVPVYGDWNNKYGYTGAGNANNEMGDDFKAGGNDIKAPAASGNYKIVVDFQRGKFTLTKL
jgi:hypothetical protein